MSENNTYFDYFIGDIHGCLGELEALVDAIDEHALKHRGHARLISVGDLVDRGPDSKGVVDYFLEQGKTRELLCILGNHEAEFLRVVEAYRPELFVNIWPVHLEELRTQFDLHSSLESSFDGFRKAALDSWLRQGGEETLESYGCNPEAPRKWAFPEAHLRYLCSLPLYLETDEAITTHALCEASDFSKVKKLSEKAKNLGLSERETAYLVELADKIMWSRSLPHGPPDRKRIHVSGHTPLDTARMITSLNLCQIDTACVYGLSLSAYAVHSAEVISVPSQVSWKAA